MQKELHTSTRALKIWALLEKAKEYLYPPLAVLRQAAEVAKVGGVRKYEHLVHRTIDQLEKLDLYQQHIDMVDLRLEGEGKAKV